jgi:hypothetical protein
VTYLGPPDFPFPSGHGESSRYVEAFTVRADDGVESVYITYFCVVLFSHTDARDPLTRTRYNHIMCNHKNKWTQSTGATVSFTVVPYYLCTVLIRVQHWGSLNITNIEKQSFRSGHIYWCDWSIIIIELQRQYSRTYLLSWFIHLVKNEFWFLRYFTDVWEYKSTRQLHHDLPRTQVVSFSSWSTTYLSQGYRGYVMFVLLVSKSVIVKRDVQVDSGRRTGYLWKTNNLNMRYFSVYFLFTLCKEIKEINFSLFVRNLFSLLTFQFISFISLQRVKRFFKRKDNGKDFFPTRLYLKK